MVCRPYEEMIPPETPQKLATSLKPYRLISKKTPYLTGWEGSWRCPGQQENLEAFKVGGISYVDMIMLDYPGAAGVQRFGGCWLSKGLLLSSR